MGRNCFLKLDNLDKKCQEFYENCQKNATSSKLRCKRMASSPAVEKRPQNRSLGDSFTKSAHTCLFPTEQGESGTEKNAHVLRGN